MFPPSWKYLFKQTPNVAVNITIYLLWHVTQIIPLNKEFLWVLDGIPFYLQKNDEELDNFRLIVCLICFRKMQKTK